MDQGHIAVPYAEDEIVLPVGKQTLDHIHEGGVPILQLAHQEHAAGNLRGHVQLLGPHVDVAEQDIVGDDILDKGTAVVLFLVIILRSIEGHAGHGADRVAGFVLSHGENGVVEPAAPAAKGMERPPIHGGHCAVRLTDLTDILRPLFADQAQIAAGDHSPLPVDHTHDPVCGFLDLQDNILKNSS